MTRILPIHGTWARREDATGDQWWQCGSPFHTALTAHCYDYLQPDDPFVWSGDVNGMAGILHRFVGKPPNDKGDWTSAARALRWYLRLYAPTGPRIVIAHSHGVNPAIYAAAAGARLDVLVTIASPVRDDMRETYRIARPNIGYWLHVYDAKFDRTGSAGAFGDGSFDWWWNPKSRHQPVAHQNLALLGISHSRLLNEDSARFMSEVLPLVTHIVHPSFGITNATP